VVGTDKSVEAPPGVSDFVPAVPRHVAVPWTTLAGLTGLSERSVRRSGDMGSPRPPRRFHDLEVFRRPAVRAVVRPPGGSRRLRLPLRVRARSPSPVPCRTGPPLLGFHAPSATSAERSCAPGLPLPAPSALGVSRPLDGLLSLRPCGHARSAAAPGVLARDALSNEEAVVHRCTRCALSSAVLYSLEL
jgi:hypothetical protein